MTRNGSSRRKSALSRSIKGAFAGTLVFIAACAMDIVGRPAPLTPSASGLRVVAAASTTVRLDSSYSRTIREGTEFVEVGSIPEGRVLKPVGDSITIVGAHIHEAYPVVRDGRIVGFYLPVEKNFSSLITPAVFPTLPRSP